MENIVQKSTKATLSNMSVIKEDQSMSAKAVRT